MRNLLIFLLLAGCSSTQLSGDLDGGKTVAEKIHYAETLCMKNGDFKDASEYNACVDNALGDSQTAKAKVAERTARAKDELSTNGLSDVDRMCERYGHVIGTEEYDVCIDYAKDNPASIKNASKNPN